MVFYNNEIQKLVKKRVIPIKTFKTFFNAFLSLDQTKDFSMFDIKSLKGKKRGYYRLKKGKYRAIFFTEGNNISVILLGKREDIYRLWQQQQQQLD